jgi:phage terminase small subunit
MARKSLEARAATVWRAGGNPPPPPSELSDEAQQVWVRVAASKSPDWFDDGNLALLESYCDLTARMRAARAALDEAGTTQPGKLGPAPSAELRVVEIINRQLVVLATKLRLTIQSALRGDSGRVSERPKINPLLGGGTSLKVYPGVYSSN